MIQHYTRLLQRCFHVDPSSAIFDFASSSYAVDRVVARYATWGSFVALFDEHGLECICSSTLTRAPSSVRKPLGMKAWGVSADGPDRLRMGVDDGRHRLGPVELDVRPYPDVRYRRERMAGRTVTEVKLEYSKSDVQLSVESGTQLLVCAERTRREDEVAALFEKGE